MATSIILIFILLLIDNVITINDWAIKDATSVVCVPNNLKLDFFVLSANKNTLNIRKEDSFGIETISKYDFIGKFEDLNVNMFFERENGTYTLFIFYDEYLQIINEKIKLNNKYPIKPGYFRNTLKKINNNFFYIATDLSLVTLNIEKISDNNYKVTYTTKTIFNHNLIINSISCDLSNNKQYYICSYFQGEDIGISLFANDTTLLKEKKFSAGVKEPKNYFNKIFFLKDNYNIISINSQNNNEIRFRHLEISENDLKIIQLYEKQKKTSDYLDIKGTQLDSSYLYNDIVTLENDEMIKVYMKSNELWISKIQFYYGKYMVTIKTKKYYDFNYRASKVHLTRRSNGIVIDYYNGNTFNFIQIGHVKTSTKQVNSEYFTIDNYEIDSLFKTKLIAEIEFIPDNFAFLRTFENTIVEKDKMVYPEDERFQIVQYRTNENESLKFQTKLLYEFPTDCEFQMFPDDETETSPETKILSLGNEGLISFKLNSCFNNFKKIENTNICTLIRPEGYYLNHDKNVYSACYETCAECITYSNDYKNMQCLKCKDGHYNEEELYNCKKYETILPQNVNIELASNEFFWVFLVIIVIGAILAFFIILYDKICCFKKTDEEIIGEITEKIELNPLYRDSNNISIN